MHLLLLAQSPVLRIGLRGILQPALPIDHVIEASNALEATLHPPTISPMVTIIQDSLAGVTGVVAARICRDLHPASAILVLSEQWSEERNATAVAYGADTLLPADIAPDLLLDRIRQLLAIRVEAQSANSPDSDRLTMGEIAILDGFARGLSFRDIAGLLQLNDEAIRIGASGLLRKLKAVDRTTAVVAAVRGGLVDLSVQLPVHFTPGDLALDSPV